MQKFTRSLIALGALTALAACGDDVSVAPQPVAAVTAVSVTGPSTISVGQIVTFGASVTVSPGSGTPSTAVTWSTGNASVATVDATTGSVTGVAAGSTVITATAGNGVSGSAAVTVGAQAPPTVSISSVTGINGQAVNFNDVNGQIDVAVNFDPGGFVVDKVELLLDGNVVATQTFTAQQLADLRLAIVSADVAEAVQLIHFLVNTAQFDASTGVASFFNGSHTLSVRVTVAGGGSGGSATPSLALVFNNASGVVLSVTNDNGSDPDNAINPTTGLAWIGGDITVKAVGVSYVQGVSFASATISGFLGKTTVLTLASNVGTKTFDEATTWSSSNAGVGEYLSTGAEPITFAGSTLSNGSAGPTSVLNGSNAIPALPVLRVDNTEPGATSANGVVQAAPTTTTPVIWVNSTTSFAAGQLGIPSASTLNASTAGVDVEEGVDNITVSVYTTASGGTLPTSGCSTTGLTLVSTGSQLTQTTVSSAYRALVVYTDALGNVACSPLSAGTQFGADFTAPTFSSVSGPANNSGSATPTASFTVNGLTDNASGFGPTPLLVKITSVDPTGTTCFTGTGTACDPIATANPTPSFDPLVQGYYTATVQVSDQAGNTVDAVTTVLYLFDNTNPAFAGGISLPSVIAGAATNTFTASVSDNLDLGDIFGAVAYPTATIEYPSQALGAFGVPFETTATANYAVADWIRCLNAAGDFSSTGNQPSNITLIVSDQASNTASLTSGAFGANAQACGTVGNIASTDINSFTQSAPNYGGTNTSVDLDGASVAAGSSTSVTLTTVADVALNSSADPFTRVDLYYQDPVSSRWIKVGSATASLAQTPTLRTYTYTFVWDPAAGVPTGTITVQAIGVDAQGDAVLSGTQTVTIVP